jgi:dienelactone hydrolase
MQGEPVTMRWLRPLSALALGAALCAAAAADKPPEKVPPVPPAGVAVPDADRAELQAACDDLGKAIDDTRKALQGKPDLLELLPDVQIYHNAVRYALQYNEFYDLKELDTARRLLKQGQERAQTLRDGKAPWAMQTGLVARGYVSRIDGSVQPYGLVVPASFQPNLPVQYRLDVWCHGRGEKLTELAFIDQRQKNPGEFTPPHAFVLHLYGRYCCANKFAGEIDCLEALESVHKRYPIDENRLAVRGFSMGGAACWQFAVHYPTLWCAAAPGAGFSETADFLKVFQKETVQPTWYEQKLWHMYDCTDYAVNLYNCPVVAYSGEDDVQKQAADKMAEAMKKEGLTLVHLIGPKTKHAYHPETKKEISRRIDALAARGRDEVPARVRFATYTLLYNHSGWVTVDGLEKHWDRATVEADLTPAQVAVETKNVSALTLSMGPGECPLENQARPHVVIDNLAVTAPPVLSDRSWTAHFRKQGGAWEMVDKVDEETLAKRHGLQGPIDDAFMDTFLMVRPTGKPLNDKVGAWADGEMKHAVDHWRKQFRGEARVKDDADVTDADVASCNLVLWGDPSSNKVLARVLDKLPVHWDADAVRVGAESFPAADHVAVLIYPNPLNPRRYVVLNSGFTFREYDYLNNARQAPKLPDFAVIDVRTPPSPRLPGAVATAGFFDEKWRLPDRQDKGE